MRVGVYADLGYSVGEGGIRANRAFVKFLAALPPRVDELVIFGRLSERDEGYPYLLPTAGVRFVAMPHYPGLRNLRSVARAWPESVSILRRELANLDVLWLFGPHPLAFAFARAARRANVPLLLGVRQNFPAYIRSRARWALPAAAFLEWRWRRIARRAPSIVVGDELARGYQGGAAVLTTGFALIQVAEIVASGDAARKDWSGPLRLLTVSRLSPEKNPMLLADVLLRIDPRWQLEIIGEGPLRARLEERIQALGLTDRARLVGYVPNGPALWERYRDAHVFLHVSHTEGIPQVLYEAQASGLPTVATDVGGVRGAMDSTVVLVPPDDARAAALEIDRIASDTGHRTQLIEAGFRNVSLQTQEAQLDEIGRFIHQQFG
jgi:glycosyltransferase involved in cell wall biosynthesis